MPWENSRRLDESIEARSSATASKLSAQAALIVPDSEHGPFSEHTTGFPVACQMSGSVLRLGIVGCGLVVERGHLIALAGIKNVRLVAVADPAADRRRIATRVARYAALDEMLAAEDLEAVLVCSPPAFHLQHAEQCADAGVATQIGRAHV